MCGLPAEGGRQTDRDTEPEPESETERDRGRAPPGGPVLTRSVRGDEFAVPSDGGQSIYPSWRCARLFPSAPQARVAWHLVPHESWSHREVLGSPALHRSPAGPAWWAPPPRACLNPQPHPALFGLPPTALCRLVCRRNVPLSPRPRGAGPVPVGRRGSRPPTPDLRPPTSSRGAAAAPPLSASAFHFSVLPSLRLKRKKAGPKPLGHCAARWPPRAASSAGLLSRPHPLRAAPGGALAAGRAWPTAGRRSPSSPCSPCSRRAAPSPQVGATLGIPSDSGLRVAGSGAFPGSRRPPVGPAWSEPSSRSLRRS